MTMFNFDEIFDTKSDGKLSCKIDPNEKCEVSLHKIVQQISANHSKIIDDWCKAYLSKEYEIGNDIHPGCFDIEQSQVIRQSQVGDPGSFEYKYRIVPNDQDLSVRVKWKTIDTAPKDGSDILLWDGEVIYLGCWIDENSYWCPQANRTIPGFYCDDYLVDATHWMKIPDGPKKDIFCCKEFKENVRHENGKPYLIEEIPDEIKFCPWCGKGIEDETKNSYTPKG